MPNKRQSIPSEDPQTPFWVLLFIIAFILLFMILRINVVAFLLLLAILLVIAGVAYLIRMQVMKKRRLKFEQSTEGMIEKWLVRCEDQLVHMKNELQDIQANIQDLQAKLAMTPAATETTRKETATLIRAFQKEQQLRQTKIEFYVSCQEKLETLKANQELVKTLTDKKERLKALQEHHFEDIANMEELRSQLAHDQRYLETIETLSLRMLESTDLDAAEHLQLELKQLTEEVRRL